MSAADPLADLRARRERLETRARVLAAVRAFFAEAGFLELETPVRLAAPALEEHIDAEPAGDAYLRTSPELHMKRLLAAGVPRLYQVGPCFRQGEYGPRHHAEYTMLEWYRAGAGYLDILEDTVRLLNAVARDVLSSDTFSYADRTVCLAPPWELVTVADAFRRHAGWDPVSDYDPDRFDLDLVNRVEPALSGPAPTVLIDYPAPAAALARLKPDDPRVAERWELYAGGMELANAYSELTDPAEQRARFEACARARAAAGRAVYPLDEDFLAALESGLPPTGGIALGIDRLVMLLTDAPTIADVRAFV